MRASSTRTRLLAGMAVAASATVLLAACGPDDSSADKSVNNQNAAALKTAQEKKARVEANLAALPARPAGRVDVDGTTSGSLTSTEADDYNTGGATAQVHVADKGATTAFGELCSGDIDLVDSSRPISKKEWQACQDNGLDLVQFQIASDALVLAIKSETDVGGDCLNMTGVRNLYRAGSPITSWSQLKFSDVGVKVSGPNAKSSEFDVFGSTALDSTDPAISDVRSDYKAFASDSGTRLYLVGSDSDIQNATYLSSRRLAVTQLRAEVATAKQTLSDAKAEVTAAEANRQKGITDGRSAAQQAKDQTRQDDSYTARAKAIDAANAVKAKLKTAEKLAEQSAASQRRLTERRGRVGYVRFSYYELYEEQLRPFEITQDGKENCIFPSQRTITNDTYPLARQMLITTTTRSLKRAEVSGFLTAYLDDAQSAAQDAQFVPLSDETITQEKKWANGTATPTLVTFGGTASSADDAEDPAR